MIAAALITTLALALTGAKHAPTQPVVARAAGDQCHAPGSQGIPDDLPPKVHSFMVWTELRALRFLQKRLDAGDLIFCKPEEAISFTGLMVKDARNARVTWHVLTHDGDFTIDWMSRCFLSDRMTDPRLWQPSGIQIRCTQWFKGWSG